jgi:hypothetical protein
MPTTDTSTYDVIVIGALPAGETTDRQSGSSSPRTRVAAGWDAHVAFALAYPAMYPTSRPLPGMLNEAVHCCAPGSTSLSKKVLSGPGSPRRWRRTCSARPYAASPMPSPQTLEETTTT